jgi:tetratricopeptide (TPR) repeat protein
MRALILCSCVSMLCWGQQPATEPLPLHDPPSFKTGQIESATDAGAHASAGAGGEKNLSVAASTPARDGVEAKLRREQSAQPKSFSANLGLGQFLLETGRAADAVSFLASARRLKPDDLAARHDLAVAYVETVKLGDAQTLLTELQKDSPGASVIHLEALWLAASGKPVAAAQRFQQAAEADPSEKHLFDWGNHMLTHGAAGPAGKIFDYAAEKFPRSARIKVAQGVAYYAQGDFDQAVRMLCAGVDLDPQDLRPLVFLGQMIDVSPTLNGEVSKRLGEFAKLYPANAQAQYFYGASLLKQSGGKAAEPWFRRAAALEPGMPEPHLELGKFYADAGRKDEAVRELESAIRLSADPDAAHYKLGQLYQQTGQTALATQHFAAYRKIRAAKAEREEQERRERSRLTEKQ